MWNIDFFFSMSVEEPHFKHTEVIFWCVTEFVNGGFSGVTLILKELTECIRIFTGVT